MDKVSLFAAITAPFYTQVEKSALIENKPNKEDLAETMRKLEAAKLKRERKNSTRWTNHQKAIQQQKGDEDT